MFPLLVPSGTADYARPESPDVPKLEAYYQSINHGVSIGESPWRFNPAQDFAQATTEELKASGLFREVALSERVTEEDLILRAELKSTRYGAKVLRYRLGMMDWLLFYLGVPMASVANELDVEFVLEERASGQRLWHKNYHEMRAATFYFYSNPPDFYYDELLNTILQDVVKNLQVTLATRRTVIPHDGIPTAIRPVSPQGEPRMGFSITVKGY